MDISPQKCVKDLRLVKNNDDLIFLQVEGSQGSKAYLAKPTRTTQQNNIGQAA